MVRIIRELLRKVLNAITQHVGQAVAGSFIALLSGFVVLLPQCTSEKLSALPPIHPDVNTSDYYMYQGEGTYQYGGGGEKELDSLRSVALRHIIIEKVIGGAEISSRWFCDDDIVGLLAKYDNMYVALLNKENPLNAFFVLKSHEHVVKSNKYTYKAFLLVPKERYLRYPVEVSKPLRENIKSIYEDKLKGLNSADSIDLVLTNNTLNINNINLSVDAKKELEDILEYAPDRIKVFINSLVSGKSDMVIDNFGSGQYRIEGNMEEMLVAFVDNFLNYRPRGYQYDIYCVGYADERLLKTAAQYTGGANFMTGETNDILFKKGYDDKKYSITTNGELSVARAYESGKIIDDYLSAKVSEGDAISAFRIFYRGGGVKKDVDPDCNRYSKYDCARQIRLKIVKKR